MFLDANIFIHAYHQAGRPAEPCKRMLSKVASAQMNASTSVLVLNEVLYFFQNNADAGKAERIFLNILSYKGLDVLAVDRKTLLFVPEYTAQGLDAADAYHAAVMRSNGLDVICTYDRGFDKVKSLRRQEPK